jgi:LacI family transcriptional regulator
MALRPLRKRSTIRDVARFAQVSHQTVSRVINGESCITPKTRARVERAIADLGFRPSHIARSLVSRSTKTIGLVIGDVASPFFPDVVRGAEDRLSEAGFCVILSSSRREPERELRNVKHLLERSTDGLILGAPQSDPQALAELAERTGVPMVLLNRDVRGRHVDSVWIDWQAATTEVVGYLAELGHRQVGLVVPSRAEARYANREDWYRPALRRAGLLPAPSLIFRGSLSIDGGYQAGLQMLAHAERPTAVICHSDAMAIGLLQACGERGVAVPGELSVIGWDDVPYARLVTPPLTTVRIPRYELGEAAALKLLDLIAGRSSARTTALPLELIRRQSASSPVTAKGKVP